MGYFFRTSVYIGLAAVGIWAYFKVTQVNVPSTIDGSTDREFERVREKFAELMKDGWISGAQYAVYYKNKLVVNLAGGYADEESDRALTTDDFQYTCSTVKSLFSLLLAVAAERGKIGVEEKIAKYWPEFGKNGKENVTIANLLLHQAGVCGIEKKFSTDDAEANNEHYQSALAEQAPLSPIAERPYYHGMTYGLYIDQVVRRIDTKKRGVRALLADEIASLSDELGIRLGLPKEEYYRLSRRYPIRLSTLRDFDSAFGILYGIMSLLKIQIESVPLKPEKEFDRKFFTVELIHRFMTDFKGLEYLGDPRLLSKFAVAAGTSVGRARDFARVYHIMANGGVLPADGKSKETRVLSKETVDQWIQQRYSGPSGMLPTDETRCYFGWMFPSPSNTTLVGSHGYGGQQGFADPELGISVAYFTNYFKPAFTRDYAYTQLLEATYEAVSDIRKNAGGD